MLTERTRPGFTLIELLIVIGILALLSGLVVMAIIPALSKRHDTADAIEIQKMSSAVRAFHAKFGVWPPSKLRLYAAKQGYDADGSDLSQSSLRTLNSIWPSLRTFSIDWKGNGDVASWGKNFIDLDGDQCLVFFLGGPKGTEGFTFSDDAPIPAPGFKGPRRTFFNFDSRRLVDRAGQGFPSYVDNWETSNSTGVKQYFVYFSIQRMPNSYHHGYNPNDPAAPIHHKISALGGVQPYYVTVNSANRPSKYWNPDSFQIIAAGQDGVFGNIGQWSSGGSTDGGTGWQDNRTNFSPSKLIAGTAN